MIKEKLKNLFPGFLISFCLEKLNCPCKAYESITLTLVLNIKVLVRKTFLLSKKKFIKKFITVVLPHFICYTDLFFSSFNLNKSCSLGERKAVYICPLVSGGE